jgi:BolA family transcriptional regulator, general stress-responsive regulator
LLSGTDPLPVGGITATGLHAALNLALQPSYLEVLDESAAHAGHVGANGTGQGTHFRVRVASPLMVGLSRVAAHRLVYDAAQKFIDAGLHALAIEIIAAHPSQSAAAPGAHPPPGM